jgi:hypothetical protein
MRTRRIVAVSLVVLATLVAFLAILAIWINRQLLETDNWTRTSTQLLERPVIRDQLAARLTDEVFSSVDFEGALADALPPRAAALAGPAANALRSQVDKTARRALARPGTQKLWADANRGAHQQLLAVLDGGGQTVSTQDGRVVLDVHRLLDQFEQELGVGGRLRKAVPASASQITLMESRQLAAAQDVARILRGLPVALVVAALALVGVAMLVAPDWRRQAVRAIGVGFVVAGLAALAVRSVAGDAVVSSLASTAAAEPSVKEVWVIGTSMLVEVAVATIAYGVAMLAWAWLAGPTAWAKAVRRTVTPYLREPLVAYAALAVLVAGLVWWEPTPAWRNGPMLVILVVLLAAGTEALRRQVIREHPDATMAVAAERRRERWGRAVAATRAGGRAVGAAAVSTAGGAAAATRAATSRRFGDSGDERIAELERLAALREAGVLDDDELRAEKARVLAGGPAVDGEHMPTT